MKYFAVVCTELYKVVMIFGFLDKIVNMNIWIDAPTSGYITFLLNIKNYYTVH